MPDPTFPILGNRIAVWIVAQLHLNFAAFILGAPIFIVISEIIGWRSRDPRYERLAHEMTKITAVAYSLTALLGGFFVFLLITLYPDFSGYIFPRFFPIWMLLYPVFFIAETVTLYTYWYSWDALQKRKGWHIAIGVLLNLIGTLVMFQQNAIASFMNTPPENWQTATVWELVNNPTWWPLNIHRFIANVTFGGFITGLVGAFMYLTAKAKEDKAFYDWMGFIGNAIGVFTFLILPGAGYIYGREIYAYDASLGIYMMSDRLSMFFELQGILIGLLFLTANYYIWLSMRRIEGAGRFALPVKAGFALIFLGNAIWVTPRHWFATMIVEPGMVPAGMTEEAVISTLELPAHLGFLALMPAKNTATAWIILVTLVNYIFYRVAIRRGKIEWGKIEAPSQYALILLGFVAIWTMGLMGAVRAFLRKSFHVYNAIPDFTAESFTHSLFFSALVVTAVSLVFFLLITFIIWLSHKLPTRRQGDKETGGQGEGLRISLSPPLPLSLSIAVLAVVVWFAAGFVGFPIAYRWFFVGYVVIALPFFVLLDTRFHGEPRRPVLAILVVFLFASVALSLAAFLLPQYSTRVEREKIARLQKAYLDRQAKERAKELLAEAEQLGLTLGAPTGLPEVSASGVGEATSELAEQGQIVYDDYECYNCHKVGGKGGVKRRGPELDNVGNLMSADALRIKLLDPRSSLSEGFEEEYDKVTMPDDFGERMSEEQIAALVAYLSTLKDPSVSSPKVLFAGRKRDQEGPWYEIPPEYQQVMPREWWTDPQIIAEGKAIYEGAAYPEVVCAACHGRDGVPILTGATDFRDADQLESLSEVYWYWRIATGVPDTPMTAWGEKLTTEEIWKVMAYESTFAYGGQPADHAAKFRPPKAQ